MIDSYERHPVLLVFAGPNGSGKTTATRGMDVVGAYVNSDDIKAECGLSDLEAAQRAETIRHALLDSGADFTFETVLSKDRNLLLMQEAKRRGYEIRCIYVLTNDVNINVARVKRRHMLGGHDVPEEATRRRYHEALALLPRVVDVSDSILIYDNSDDYHASLIFSKNRDGCQLYPNNNWSEDSIKKLIGM